MQTKQAAALVEGQALVAQGCWNPARAKQLPLTVKSYATDHHYRDAVHRERILRDVATFLRDKIGTDCE